MGLTRATESMNVHQAREGLTNYLIPTTDGGWRDIYRSGWQPSWFNQQWGGAQWGTEMIDGATGQMYKFDVATGNIEDNSYTAVSSTSASYHISQGFKASDSFTLDSAWLKLYKVTSTTHYNLTVRVYSDNGSGAPSAALGTASLINMRQLSSNANGDWFRVTGLNCPLVAGTQYHLVCTTSTVDAGSYVCWKHSATRKYPLGYCNFGTSTPVWTPTTTIAYCFLLEAPSASQFLQSNGLFDKKLVFAEGSPINQSKSLVQPMVNFFDGAQFTYLVRGNSFAKNKPVCDFLYGLDHDRISLIPDATSGVGVLRVYNKVGTLFTVTGTTDLSTVGNKDISISIRSKGDAGDYIKLYVNGTLEGTSITGQAISFDPLMRELGTAYIGGGFPVPPAWAINSLSGFTSLPSANGWTWGGSALESTAMSVANGKLYQSYTGYSPTQDGYYSKSSLGLSNTTGWTVFFKVRNPRNTNTMPSSSAGWTCELWVADGTKQCSIAVQEFFISGGAAAADFIYQTDMKTQDRVVGIHGKGSDYYVTIDGRLIADCTGKLTAASASNTIGFGDYISTTTSGENADAIWSYVKYYTGGMTLPQASTGASFSESAFWAGDKTKLLKDVYNSGTPISVKNYIGMERNYVGEGVTYSYTAKGVSTGSNTSNSTTYDIIPQMTLFCIGQKLSGDYVAGQAWNGVGGASGTSLIPRVNSNLLYEYQTVANSVYFQGLSSAFRVSVPLMLHQVSLSYVVGGGSTGGVSGTARRLDVKASLSTP